VKVFQLLLFSCCIALTYLPAQNLVLAKKSAKQDLENAITQLNDLRKTIEQKKIPLSSEVNFLEKEAQEKRQEVDRRIRMRDNRDANLIQLKEEVKASSKELDSIQRILADYTRSWSEFTPPAEKIITNKLIQDTLKNSPPDRKSQLESLIQTASISAKFIGRQAGGMNFIGDAIVPPEGTREQGIFWSIGPEIYFSGLNGSSGLVEKRTPSSDSVGLSLARGISLSTEPARLVPSSVETSQLVRETLQSNTKEIGLLPLDPTQGKASVLEVGEPSFIEELQKGGIWIYPILFFALLSTIIAIYKAFQILSIPSPRIPVTLAGHFSGPFERLRKTAQGYRGNKPEILEEILYEIIIDCQERLEKGLPLVAITAAIAPLLGLLGTVTGMIDVFRQITNFANPENSELARGISEALVTTKFGLVTAIPALVIHALLNRRLQGMISKMEGFSARLVHLKKENPKSLPSDKKDELAD
jgi:biopolymer transport protein ExbB